MGYSAYVEESNFYINSERIPECLKAVMTSNGSYETPKEAAKNIKHFEHLPTLIQLIELVQVTYGFKLIPNKSGNIDKITYEWEKLRNEEEFFKSIAPFVRGGSYVGWCGEDGAKWRHVFRGGNLKKINPIITWPE